VDDAIDIAHQIACAMEAAHEQGIVHRDLKPSNIRVAADGRVKVLDFGLAKALDSADGDFSPDMPNSPTALVSSPTVPGIILGTAGYMSPEQARGKRVDKRSDIFAFGVVLYEMLTGRSLFTGESVSDTLAAILRETPDFEKLPRNTPSVVKRLLARCLEKDPRRRLRDIGEARIMLEDVRSGVAPALTPPPASPWLMRAGWIAAAAMLVLAAAALFNRPDAPHAPLQVRRSSMVLSKDDPAFRNFFTPSISPDGRYVAFTSHEEIWLRDLSQIHARPIPGTRGGTVPFWSADGEWIGFRRENALMRVRRDGGEPSQIATLPFGMTLDNTGSALWDEQDFIVIGPNNSGLHRVSARGGEVVHWVRPGPNESDFHEVGLLPDGHGYVAVLHSSTGIGDLVRVTPDGERKTVLHLEEIVSCPSYSPSGHLVFARAATTPSVWAVPYDLEASECTGDPFLVAPGGHEPTVANDGTLCYVESPAEPQLQLVWIDRQGSVVGKIEPPDFTSRPFPSISPDGQKVVLAVGSGDSREDYLYDLKTGTRRRLTFTDYPEEAPHWHPNGVDLLDYTFNPPRMYVISTRGGTSPRLLGEGVMPVVSSDGMTLVYVLRRPGNWNWDIVMRPIDGDSKQVRDLIHTPAEDWLPSFSPDGKFLAYASRSSGREEVYVTTFPEPSTLWQVSTQGGSFPLWRSDGREIMYTTLEQIWAVDVAPKDGALEFGTPHALCKRPTTNFSSGVWPDGFDISADGQKILLLQPVSSESDPPPAIVIVQNWYEEFRDLKR
jgi:Tol biopolymer transport system component